MGPPPPPPLGGSIDRMNGDPEAVIELLSCKCPHIMHLQLKCQNQPNDEEYEDVGLASDDGVDEYDY